MRWASGLWAAVEREWRAQFKSRSDWVMNVIQPLAYFVFFAPSLSRLVADHRLGPAPTYMAFVLPGLLAVTTFMVGMRTGVGLYIERVSGTLESLFALPVAPGAYVAAKMISGVPLMAAYTAVGLVAAYALGWRGTLTGVLAAFAIVLLTYAAFCYLMLFTVLSVRNEQVLGTAVNLVGLPLTFGSTAFYALSAVPPWLKPLALVNPVSLCSDGLRDVMFGTPAAPGGVWLAFLGICAWGAAFSILTTWRLKSLFE